MKIYTDIDTDMELDIKLSRLEQIIIQLYNEVKDLREEVQKNQYKKIKIESPEEISDSVAKLNIDTSKNEEGSSSSMINIEKEDTKSFKYMLEKSDSTMKSERELKKFEDEYADMVIMWNDGNPDMSDRSTTYVINYEGIYPRVTLPPESNLCEEAKILFMRYGAIGTIYFTKIEELDWMKKIHHGDKIIKAINAFMKVIQTHGCYVLNVISVAPDYKHPAAYKIEIATATSINLKASDENMKILEDLDSDWIIERRVRGMQVLGYQLQKMNKDIWIYVAEPDLFISTKKAGKEVPIYQRKVIETTLMKIKNNIWDSCPRVQRKYCMLSNEEKDHRCSYCGKGKNLVIIQ